MTKRRAALLSALRWRPGFSRVELICGVVLALMGLNLWSNAALRSLTNDELVHIPSAHRYLVERNFTLNPEHPPLAKLWAALPLSLLHVQYYRTVDRGNQDFAAFTTSYASDFWELNRRRWWQITFWSRAPMVLVTLALGVLIFVYVRTFFTARAAIFAVLLFSLEPTMLAHGWIVHTDVPAAFAYLLFFLMMHRYWMRPTLVRALWLGLATGVALLVKFSLVIVVPVFVMAVVYKAVRHTSFQQSRLSRLGQAALTVSTAVVVVNVGYFFQSAPLSPPDSSWIVSNAGLAGDGTTLLNVIHVLSKFIPAYYLFGIQSVIVHNQHGHPSSLLGSYGASGWWYYFPVAFAVKTSLPFLLLAAAAIGWALWAGFVKREKLMLVLLAAIALYLTMAMTSRINIGVRHIAPIFPFLFILGGIFLDRFLNGNRARLKTVVVALMFGWMLFETGRAYPRYLGYTNQLTFGKANWQVLSDSNVEWGQDIGALARYLQERNETTLTATLSAGWMTPDLHGIKIIDRAPPDLQSSPTRFVALGASYLNGSTVSAGLKDAAGEELSEDQRINYFAKYRTLKPERIFGDSIYLYRKPE